MKKMLQFIDKWGFRMLFPLILIMFLKTCGTNSKIEKINKELVIKTQKLDSLITVSINKPFISKDEMIFLLKNTPNWKTLELEELSDKNRIPINKLKNDTFLSREMMDCFVTCYNNGGVDSFGSTLVKYLNQICKQLDINIFPLCCSDSNLRSHKEKNDVGWETVIDTTKIEEIIHNTVTDIFMETGCMIPLDARERKKICNIVKKSYGLSSLKMLDELEDSSEIYIPLEP